MPQVKNSEGLDSTNSDGVIEQLSELEELEELEKLEELQELFCYIPERDWSTATDEELAVACAESKEFLGF